MKLSTKSRYGLRAMLVLALQTGDKPLMSREIAERQNLPVTYLEQLMLALKKASLVHTTRGAKGGYLLARTPERISLAEIIEALDGTVNIAACADVPSCCLVPEACALREVFAEANASLRGFFDAISLAKLAEKQRAKGDAGGSMYFI